MRKYAAIIIQSVFTAAAAIITSVQFIKNGDASIGFVLLILLQLIALAISVIQSWFDSDNTKNFIEVCAVFIVGALLIAGLYCRTISAALVSLAIVVSGILSIWISLFFTRTIAAHTDSKKQLVCMSLLINASWIGLAYLLRSVFINFMPGVVFEYGWPGMVLSGVCAPYASPFWFDLFTMNRMMSGYSSGIGYVIPFILRDIIMCCVWSFLSKTSKKHIVSYIVPISISVVSGIFAFKCVSNSTYTGYKTMFIYLGYYLLSLLVLSFVGFVMFSDKHKEFLVGLVFSNTILIALIFLLSLGIGFDTYVPAHVDSVVFNNVVYSDQADIDRVCEINKLVADVTHDMSSPYSFSNSDVTRVDSYGTDYWNFVNAHPLIKETAFSFSYQGFFGFDRNFDASLLVTDDKRVDEIESLLSEIETDDTPNQGG